MRFAAVVLLLASINGCAAQMSRHKTACGPTALASAYGGLGIKTTPAEVSGEIVAHSTAGTTARSLLGMFCPAVHSVTWPWEIEANARRHGLAVRPFIGMPTTAGVALLRTGLLSYHYVATPLSKDDAAKYGGRKVVRAWLFTKPSPATKPTTKPTPPPAEVVAVNAALEVRVVGWQRWLSPGEVGIVFFVDWIEGDELAVLDSGERVPVEMVCRVARAKWPGRTLWTFRVPLPTRA